MVDEAIWRHHTGFRKQTNLCEIFQQEQMLKIALVIFTFCSLSNIIRADSTDGILNHHRNRDHIEESYGSSSGGYTSARSSLSRSSSVNSPSTNPRETENKYHRSCPWRFMDRNPWHSESELGGHGFEVDGQQVSCTMDQFQIFSRLAVIDKRAVKTPKHICYLSSSNGRSWLDTHNSDQKLEPWLLLHRKSSILFRYEVTELIGCGSFGVVLKAVDHCSGGQSVAIKVLFPQDMAPRLQRIGEPLKQITPFSRSREAQRELELFQLVNDQCSKRQSDGRTLRLLSGVQMDGMTMLVMPYLGFSLHDLYYSTLVNTTTNTIITGLSHQHHDSAVDMKWLQEISKQLFQALECMHNIGIAHNDIKPDNIMFESLDNPVSIKLIDFSLSLFDRGDKRGKWDRVTAWYEDPMITLKRTGSVKSDIWSVGMILAEIYYRRPILPISDEKLRLYAIGRLLGVDKLEAESVDLRGSITYQHVNHMLKERWHWDRVVEDRMYQNQRFLTAEVFLKSPSSDDIDSELELFRDLVLKCLTLDPQLRISASDALMHPFFANVN